MFVCDLKCFQNFLIYSDVCIIHPLVSCLCIVSAFLGVLKRFSLGCSCIFIIDLIQPYYIVSCICLDNIVCNFTFFEST